MTAHERKLKKRVQLVVASSIAVFFCLVVVLAVTLTIRINQRNTIARLQAREAQLIRAIDNQERLSEYYQSQKFINELAIQEFQMGPDGSKIFK